MFKDAPDGRTVTLWPSGKVSLEAGGFGYQSLYGGDRLYPLRCWHVRPGERRPWTYELLRDIREAAGTRPARLPGIVA